jgi:hypothetical protein
MELENTFVGKSQRRKQQTNEKYVFQSTEPRSISGTLAASSDDFWKN